MVHQATICDDTQLDLRLLDKAHIISNLSDKGYYDIPLVMGVEQKFLYLRMDCTTWVSISRCLLADCLTPFAKHLHLFKVQIKKTEDEKLNDNEMKLNESFIASVNWNDVTILMVPHV